MLLERDAELAAVADVLSSGGIMLIEGGAGMGKTALLEAACRRAAEQDMAVLRARCSELETEFAFGVVRQLFERTLLTGSAVERETLLAGPAAAAWSLLADPVDAPSPDASFAMLHGLYWLLANLATPQRVVLAVDDAQWADRASWRWLGYLAPRIDGVALALLVTLRASDPPVDAAALQAMRAGATTVARPRPLSQRAIAVLARQSLAARADAQLCARVWRLSGGNPFYVGELLRAIGGGTASADEQDGLVASAGTPEVLQHLEARLRRLGPAAIRLAEALAVLGDGCALRHAGAMAGLSMNAAMLAADSLVAGEVLAEADPPRFLHPIVHHAVGASLDHAERRRLHRAAAELLFAERAPAGQVAAHLRDLPPAADAWVCARLREAANAASASGAPQTAAELLRRAWDEPPPAAEQVAVLRALAGAEVTAGRGRAREWLEQALARAADPRERADIARQVARAHTNAFRWTDAVAVIDRAIAELGDADPQLRDQLEAEVVVAGLHDARCAARVGPAVARLAARDQSAISGEALLTARGMAAVLAGSPAAEIRAPLQRALSTRSPATNWDTNWDTTAALLWCLVTAEGFADVAAAVDAMQAELRRTGSTRGLIAVHSALGFLNLRLGALPEADAAARIALEALQDGDFAPGLPFAITVLADIAVEAGDLDRAEALLNRLPAAGWSPGVGTVLIPAAWGRLHLAAGRPGDAISAFRTCASMFDAETWGMDIRDVGYLHARSGAAQALLALGDRDQACVLAESELADVRSFGAPRALGVALRTAGLAYGGPRGFGLLTESVGALTHSPALLERAKSLAELGAAQRRAGQRTAAREHLTEALDLAARCGAGLLVGRVRAELRASGARPRREWRRGIESLTPAELRVARLAAADHTNREIAQTLYVTVKTVEGHLARAYAKLQITGRTELGEALGEPTARVPHR